ncbi:PRA1 family protein B4, partial [Mucuna pruriens]
MASPSPAPSPQVLPVSNPQFQTATEAPSQPAFRAILNYLSGSLRQSLSQRRPWSELTDRSALSKPLSFSEATLRVRHNVSYFRVNYYIVVSLILAVSLLSNPVSLFLLLALLGSWLFLYLLRPADQPLRLFGRTFSDFEALSLLAGATFILLFLTSLGSLLVTAFTLSVSLVAAHAAFRVPEDLFLDERDASQPAGLLSIIRAAVAVPPAAPSVPARG